MPDDVPWRAKSTGIALVATAGGGGGAAGLRSARLAGKSKGKGKGSEAAAASSSSSSATSRGLSVAKHPDPIGQALAADAVVEAAGPDCLVPGLQPPVRVMGVQVWPISQLSGLQRAVSWKSVEPVTRELQTLSKFAEKAIDLMNAPLGK